MNSPYFRLHFAQAMNDLSQFLGNQPKQKREIFATIHQHMVAMQVLLFRAFDSEALMSCVNVLFIIGTCIFIII